MPTLDIFPWSHNLDTGIELIDTQHKGLVDLLNILVNHLTIDSDAPTLNAIFDQLHEYARVHFRDEEAIWEEVMGADDWAHEHEREHCHFSARILALKAEQGVKPIEQVMEDVAAFLSHWLALHILESDKRLARAVLSFRQGTPLDEAKHLAQLATQEDSKNLISTVLHMYDSLSKRTLHLAKEIARRKKSEALLRQAREKALQVSEAKGNFLANMSHEIRTPMNAILGFCDLIHSRPLDPTQLAHLNKVMEAGRHLVHVVNDILDYSKIEAGKFEISSQAVDLRALLAAVMSMLEQNAAAKNVRLLATVDPQLPFVLHGDPVRITQSLLNLANNSVKFTPEGSVHLKISIAENADTSSLVRFEVEDTGVGIEPDDLGRLFQPFQQVGSGTSQATSSTGLGLSITRHLAELMGGEVGVSSVPKVGSKFWFTARMPHGVDALPGLQITEPMPQFTPEAIQLRMRGKRVLLAEDEAFNQELAVIQLEAVGMEVHVADDGLKAVAMVRASEQPGARTYDLVLMDMQMPHMDGLQATRALRESGFIKPIIAMTANAFSEDRQKCLSAGMDSFITKPVETQMLFREIMQWIRE